MLWRADDHARRLAMRTGTARPVLVGHLMIADGASSSPCSASVTMGAGTPTLGPSHKGASSQPGDRRHHSLSDGTRHQDTAPCRSVLCRHCIPTALDNFGEDYPGHSSGLQSP